MAMLRDLVHYVLVGHSERRHIFNENDDVAAKKTQAAVRNGIMPILCVGETLQERLAGDTNQILHNQLTAGLMNLTAREVSACVVAYEPVWAIGTGEFAMPEQVAKAIDYIRKQVEHLFGERAAENVRILYGGSVNAQNCCALATRSHIDGLFIGRAAWTAAGYVAIVQSVTGAMT